MAAYRPLGQFNQYFLSNGAVNNGGSITFYATDLTTLKDTYSDPALTVLNSNPVTLDSAGRLSADVWGSGDYGAVIKDRAGTVIETRNNIQSGAGTGNSIPALVNGNFLTNDGANLLWQSILQVPDPTGYTGNVLYSDGTISYWGSIPAAASPDIVITSSSFRAGISSNTSKFLLLMGSDTAPASGTYTTSKTITFGTAFTTCLHASAQPVGASNPGGPMVSYPSAAATSTGVTFVFDVAEGNSGQSNIVNPVPFTWFAIGFLTVP